MRITGSDIALAASSQRVQFQQQTATVRMWREGQQDDRRVGGARAEQPRAHEVPARRASAEQQEKVADARRQLWSNDPMLARYIDLLERMFGVKVAILDPDDLQANGAGEINVATDAERPSLAITVDLSHTRYEAEQVEFRAAGRVTTSDGRTIDLQVSSKISREFLEHSEQHFAFGAAAQKKDPLVLNLDGLPATLTDATMEFDLDADGQLDRFHILGGGSAYLSWDRNGNGVVDDGTELFGPSTGDGYTELAAHDYDGNGWIDEADAIYAQLSLWRPSPAGPGTTTSLSAAQIGAIYLGQVATPFTLTPGSSEQARGDVRATGLYLREDGSAATVQQLDLRV